MNIYWIADVRMTYGDIYNSGMEADVCHALTWEVGTRVIANLRLAYTS